MSLVNRYIGTPIRRVEDLRFLRGCGEYVADLAHAEMLHAAILRSPVAHACIRAIDPMPALRSAVSMP
jgi:aerobic carbon-monoxide dehydrogenase large subunit